MCVELNIGITLLHVSILSGPRRKVFYECWYDALSSYYKTSSRQVDSADTSWPEPYLGVYKQSKSSLTWISSTVHFPVPAGFRKIYFPKYETLKKRLKTYPKSFRSLKTRHKTRIINTKKAGIIPPTFQTYLYILVS